MKRTNSTTDMLKSITRSGMVAALYVGLTMLSSVFGLSSGVIQCRLSEALCILPLFMPEAVIGVTLGCFIANAITSPLIWDLIFGTLATFIGALGAYLLRKVRFYPLATLPTVLANTLIIPFVLKYAYMAEGSLPFFFLTVGIGEIISAGLLGTVLGFGLKKTGLFIE